MTLISEHPSEHQPSPAVLARQGNTEAILQTIAEGANLGFLRGLLSKDMEAIYAVAHNLYNNGRFSEAEKVFQFLCFYGHLDKKHWQGLGGCRQALAKYSQAVEAYAMMALCDASDPNPAFYAAQCLFQSGRADDAYQALLAVVDLSGNNPRHRTLRGRARQLLAARKTPKSQTKQKPPSRFAGTSNSAARENI